jgi:hypothetical protein
MFSSINLRHGMSLSQDLPVLEMESDFNPFIDVVSRTAFRLLISEGTCRTTAALAVQKSQ